jgi:hypothetical protein
MLSSQESSASIMTSWLIQVPQLPDGSFGARQSREIKVPVVSGDTFGSFKFNQAPKSEAELSGTSRTW